MFGIAADNGLNVEVASTIKETASAVLKGDANAWHLMYQGAKTKAQEFVPHRDS